MAANGNSVSVVAYGIADGAGGGGAGGLFLKTNSSQVLFTAMANGGTGGMQNQPTDVLVPAVGRYRSNTYQPEQPFDHYNQLVAVVRVL